MTVKRTPAFTKCVRVKIKRTPADQWFSKCVRIRTNWTCEYCNINFEHDKGSLHCSHYISRAHHITRYNPINAMAHCQRCHEQLGGGRWGGGNIAEFAHHYDEIHGPKNREKIRKISHYPFPKHCLLYTSPSPRDRG